MPGLPARPSRLRRLILPVFLISGAGALAALIVMTTSHQDVQPADVDSSADDRPGTDAPRPVAARFITRMPGKSYAGPLPSPDADRTALADELAGHVRVLGEQIGERTVRRYAQLVATADYVERSLVEAGYTVERQRYDVRGNACWNLSVEKRGTKAPEEIVVVGAHYDSACGAAGANDNGSGVAALLVLAARMHDQPTGRTLRFVAFTNEEQPYFQTDLMGSAVYARRCKRRGEQIVAMLSLETMGYFRDAPGTQKYPPPLDRMFPSTGNFIGFIANVESARLLQDTVGHFRRHARIPSEGCAAPASLTGIGWSDHWSFWQHGYPALMVTDTALFRYPYYHTAKDTPDKLDYRRLALVVEALEPAIAALAAAAE